MKVFFKKLLPYCLILILIAILRFAFWGGILADKRTFFVTENLKLFENGVVVIGDSKSQFAFNDSILNSKIGIQFRNISIWGARPLDMFENVESIQFKNTLIYIVISSRTFLEPDTMYAFHQDFKWRDLFDFNLFNSIENEFLLPLKRRSAGAWEYTQQGNGSLAFKALYRPWGVYARESDSIHQAVNIENFSSNLYIDYKIQHISKLINRLNKSGNHVKLISLPERVCYKSWTQDIDYQLFMRIQKKTGYSVMDFGTLPDSVFYDSHHLNKEGAKKFSNVFLDSINNTKKL
jgi:hypothetical protein